MRPVGLLCIALSTLAATAGLHADEGSQVTTAAAQVSASWPAVEVEARELIGKGALRDAVAALKPDPLLPPWEQIPTASARAIWGELLSAAMAKGDINLAADAAFGLASCDDVPLGLLHGVMGNLPERGAIAADGAIKLLQRAGRDTARAVDLFEIMGGNSDTPSQQRQIIEEAIDGLRNAGEVACAGSLAEAYDLALGSTGDTRVAEMCAQVVLALPGLDPHTWEPTVRACACLGAAVAGNERLEEAWLSVLGGATRNGGDPGARRLAGALAVALPDMLSGTARPGSAAAMLSAAVAYEDMLRATATIGGRDRELAALFAKVAAAADVRGRTETASEACAKASGYFARIGADVYSDDALVRECARLAIVALRAGTPGDGYRALVSLATGAPSWRDAKAYDVLGQLCRIGVEVARGRGDAEQARWLVEQYANGLWHQPVSDRFARGMHRACSSLEDLGLREDAYGVRVAAARACYEQGIISGTGTLISPVVSEAVSKGDNDAVCRLVQPLIDAGANDLRAVQGEGAGLLDCCLAYARSRTAEGDTQSADQALRIAVEALSQRLLRGSSRVTRLRSLAALEAASLVSSSETKWYLLDLVAKMADQDRVMEAMSGTLREQAVVARAAGNLELARDCLSRLIRLQEERRGDMLFDPELRRQWFTQAQLPYEMLIGVACDLRNPDLALEAGEWKRARTFIERLRERQLDLANLVPPNLRAERDELVDLRRRVYAALMAGGASSSGDEERGVYMPLRGVYMPLREGALPWDSMRQEALDLLGELTARQAAFDAALREAVPGYDVAAAATPGSAAELKQLIGKAEGQLAIQYSLSEGRYVAVAVAASGETEVARVEAEADTVDALVRTLREAITGHDADTARASGRRLYDSLIGPFQAQLAGRKLLTVVADGGLHLLPFDGLVDPDGRYLVERVAVRYAPSLTVLAQKLPQRPIPPKGLLALGDPTFGQVLEPGDERGVYMPLRGGAITPLPGTREEVARIAAGFGTDAQVLLGGDATRERLIAAAPDFRVLHIATHAFCDLKRPDYSAIVLAPSEPGDLGLLHAFEIYDLRLNTDLITLSCCETGVGETVLGEGVLGLSRAFMFAGAKQVVCSLWRVSDAATVGLMGTLYDGMRAKLPLAEALRQAKLSMLGDPASADPFCWASFVLQSGPGEDG